MKTVPKPLNTTHRIHVIGGIDGVGRIDLSFGAVIQFELRPGWTVAARFLDVDGRPVLCELRVLPTEPLVEGQPQFPPGEWSKNQSLLREPERENGVTARLLREISLSEIFTEMRQQLKDAAPWMDESDPLVADTKLTQEAWEKRAPRPGRAGRSDAYYALWAARYVEKTGSPRPVAELAEEHGLKPAQIRDLVHTARVRKLLTKTGRGRSGGYLTAKGRAALTALEG